MCNIMSRKSNQNRDEDATGDKGYVAPWSDVVHDVLFLVMMQLGVIDFLAFSGVCKSWRLLALSNKKTSMASMPPMDMWISKDTNGKDSYCYLKDFKERRFRTIIPHSAGRWCFGLTCGYLILFSEKTCDFWLVNPITRHELHFPHLPLSVDSLYMIKAVLVFSPSISGWVFVVLHRKDIPCGQRKTKILFYIAGKRGWNHVSSTLPIFDLQYFKGKLYTQYKDGNLGEFRLYPNQKHKWTLVEPKNFPKADLSNPELVTCGEKLYLTSRDTQANNDLELDIGEKKWVSPQKTIETYAFFLSDKKSSAAVKPQSWVGAQTQYNSFNYVLENGETGQGMLLREWRWYFPHECLNVNLLDE